MELSRRTTRAQWKVIWRQERIVRRETEKAAYDCMLHGIGYVEITSVFPFVRRIDPAAIITMMGGDDGKV